MKCPRKRDGSGSKWEHGKISSRPTRNEWFQGESISVPLFGYVKSSPSASEFICTGIVVIFLNRWKIIFSGGFSLVLEVVVFEENNGVQFLSKMCIKLVEKKTLTTVLILSTFSKPSRRFERRQSNQAVGRERRFFEFILKQKIMTSLWMPSLLSGAVDDGTF